MKKTAIIILGALVVVAIVILLILNPFAKKEEDESGKKAAEQYKKGLALYEAGDYGAAETALQKAASLNQKDARILSLLIESQFELQKIDQAESSLTKLAAKFPDLPERFFLEGKLLFLKGEYDAAEKKLSRALEKDENLDKVFLWRARSKEKLGLQEDALEDYLTSADKDTTTKKLALEGAAGIYTDLKKYPKAISIYTSFLANDSSDTSALLNRANCEKLSGDINTAISDYSNAIELDPSLGEAYLNRGICYAQSGDLQKTIADSKLSAEKNYKPVSSWYNAAKAALTLGKVQDAVNYLEKIPKEDEDTAMLIKSDDLLGGIYMMKAEYKKAVNCFSSALAKDPSLENVYFNRGIAYGLLEDYQSAVNDLQKSKNLGNHSAEVYYALGVQQLNLHKNEEACKNLEKAVSMGHQDAKIYQLRHCKQYE